MNDAVLIEQVTEWIYEADPGLLERYGEQGKDKCRQDNRHHLDHLRTAYDLRDERIFADYAVWLDGILRSHGMTTQLLIDNFKLLQKAIDECRDVAEPERKAYGGYLAKGITVLQERNAREVPL